MRNFDFVVIDFETATRSNKSACSVGIVAIKDMEVVDTFYSLIDPPFHEFDSINTSIHGITAIDVVGCPTAPELWESIQHYFTGLVLAHNAHFDMTVLENSFGLDSSHAFSYVDTMAFARQLDLPRKGLACCAEHFEIDMGKHHNALDDALTCANFILCTLNHFNCSSLDEFLSQYNNIQIRNFPYQKQTTTPSKFPNAVKLSEIEPSPGANLTHTLLSGCNIVFTGELSMDRREAMQLAVDAGACLRSSVSGKTDYLVVGMQGLSINGIDGSSSKQKKAEELIASGKSSMEILNEAMFCKLLATRIQLDLNEPVFQLLDFTTHAALLDHAFRKEILAQDAAEELLSFRVNTGYAPYVSTIYYGSSLIARFKLGGKEPHFSIHARLRRLLPSDLIYSQIASEKDFVRIPFNPEEAITTILTILLPLLRNALASIPKTFDCCSRYMACSDAKKCIHPDKPHAMECGYRKIMLSGRIFYGKNATDD